MEETTSKSIKKQEIVTVAPLTVDDVKNVTKTNGYVHTNDTSLSYRILKRLFDVIVSSLCFIIFSPIFLFVSIVIKIMEPKGPVFFGHERNGKNGKKFKMYKFRSMCLNAEERLMSDRNLYQKYKDNGYKLNEDEDPRVTKIGKFIRKTSIDELPQLLNVLKGEMSLVGPRPIPDTELEEYKELKSKFLSVKPGITGWWQVSGRSNVGYPERCQLELYYVNNISTKMDLLILIKTVKSVLQREGAC